MAPRIERVRNPFGAQDPPGRGDPGADGRLRLRALTGWEEEYLEGHQHEPNTARLCNEVLARCLVPPGTEPGAARDTVRNLTVAERDRELIALRRLSLGPQVTARVACPACGEPNETEFSLDDLPLDFPSPDPVVRVELEDAGEAVLRLPTAGDQEDLLDASPEGEAEQRSWLLARCLERYGDRVEGIDLDFVRSLPVRCRAELAAAIEARLPDLHLQMALDCVACQAAVSAPFDVRVFFFSS